MNPVKVIKAMFTSAPRFSASECFDRVRAGTAVLIDVRETAEWESGVAESAALLPMSDFNGSRLRWQPFLDKLGDREALPYCAAGVRSGFVARVLISEGIRAANVGSLAEWAAAGWPIVRPPEGSR